MSDKSSPIEYPEPQAERNSAENSVDSTSAAVSKTASQAASEAALSSDSELKCPLCGRPLVLRSSKRGDFLGCSGYPQCNYLRAAPTAHQVRDLLPLNTPCPKCGGQLYVKRGRYGQFVGCANYPVCNYIYEERESSSVRCPLCGKGELIRRTSGSGRIFYGCSAYPDCTFTTPGQPVARQCGRCSFPVMFEKHTPKGVKLYCANSLCPSRRHRRLGKNTAAPSGTEPTDT